MKFNIIVQLNGTFHFIFHSASHHLTHFVALITLISIRKSPFKDKIQSRKLYAAPFMFKLNACTALAGLPLLQRFHSPGERAGYEYNGEGKSQHLGGDEATDPEALIVHRRERHIRTARRT